MKVLLIGATGAISEDVMLESVRRGHDVTAITRGRRPLPEGVKSIVCDVRDTQSFAALTRGMEFDAAVDFLSYRPEDLLPKLDTLRGRCGQFIFISSCAVYDRGYGQTGTRLSAIPPFHGLISEDRTPTANFGWDYARGKIACELELMKEQFLYGSQFTVIRPSETYNHRRVPGTFVVDNAWYTQIDRLLKGKATILHDDGLAKAVFTHAEDLARALVSLYGNPKAYGEAFHITTDELITWRGVTETLCRLLGVEPRFKCIPSDVLCRIFPHSGLGSTYGVVWTDKHFSLEGFDNSKIRAAVPGFACRISFEEGMKRLLNWYAEHPEERRISDSFNAKMDRLAQWEP